MKKLDRNRPYGEIFGKTENGAKFHQDGVDFDAHGNPCKVQPQTLGAASLKVNTNPVKIEEETDAPDESPAAVDDDSPAADDGDDAVDPDQPTKPVDSDGGSEEAPVDDGPDLEKLSAAEIKKRVVAVGGEYINKAQGVAFLESLDND